MLINNPLAILLLSKNRSDNENSLRHEKSSISVLKIRGINCVYFILLPIHKKLNATIDTLTVQRIDPSNDERAVPFYPIPFNEIFIRFLGLMISGEFLSLSDKISYMIIFTRLNHTELPVLRYLLQRSNYVISKKVSCVLLSKSDFEQSNPKNFSKSVILYGVHFNLKSLKNFIDYYIKVNERHFLFYTYIKIIQSVMQLQKIKKSHPLIVSRTIKKSAESSNTLREVFDYFVLLIALEARNLSVAICEYGKIPKRMNATELLPSENHQVGLKGKKRFSQEGELLFFEQITHCFLTCYNFPIVSISFFVSPFDPIVWVFFICSAIVITLLWIRISHLNGVPNVPQSFSLTLFMISTVIDDSCGTPGWLNKQNAFRISFAGWFLAMIVLVNGYISILISGLTFPFDKETIRHFQNLTI